MVATLATTAVAPKTFRSTAAVRHAARYVDRYCSKSTPPARWTVNTTAGVPGALATVFCSLQSGPSLAAGHFHKRGEHPKVIGTLGLERQRADRQPGTFLHDDRGGAHPHTVALGSGVGDGRAGVATLGQPAAEGERRRGSLSMLRNPGCTLSMAVARLARITNSSRLSGVRIESEVQDPGPSIHQAPGPDRCPCRGESCRCRSSRSCRRSCAARPARRRFRRA